MLLGALHVVIDEQPGASLVPVVAAGLSAIATASAAYSARLTYRDFQHKRTRALRIGGGFVGRTSDRFALYLDNDGGRSLTIRSIRFVYDDDTITADPQPINEPDWHIPSDGALVVEYPLSLMWRQTAGRAASDSNPLRVVNVYTTSGHWFYGDLSKPLATGKRPGFVERRRQRKSFKKLRKGAAAGRHVR